MIDVSKVRKWVVKFSYPAGSAVLPYPVMVVGEEECAGYAIAGSASIPQSEGGQLTFTLSGQGVFYAHGQKYICSPGSAFLYRRNDAHICYGFDKTSRKPWCFLWVQFAGIASAQLVAELNARYGYFFEPGENSLLAHQLGEYEKLSGTLVSLSAVEGCRLVLDWCEALLWSEFQSKRLGLHQLESRVRQEMAQGCEGKLSSGTLAQQFGVSREHLSRTFHRETGKTLSEFQNEERVRHAQELLEHTNLSCKEIAGRCRFGSYSSFYRAMCTALGQSPNKIKRPLGMDEKFFAENK